MDKLNIYRDLNCVNNISTMREFMPDLRHYVPLDIRKKNYEEVRGRIFNSNSRKVSPKIIKVRQKFTERKNNRKLIVSSIGRASLETQDPRVFIEIEIDGRKVNGLLDSGASVSILGKNCRELIQDLNINIQPMMTNVKTASGQQHRILGKAHLTIKYNDDEELMLFYLCPDLEQDLYLGIDFWRKFKLAPDIVGIEEINFEKIANDFRKDEVEYKIKPHVLTAEQESKLEKIVKEFDTFEEKGLGCTTLEKHTIKLIEGAVPVKDRYYPISPAVQEITFNEIDNMLKLKVIEESDSPWSNRTTVVRKPGKNRFCLDARKLNKLTVKDAYPLQNIDGILSRIDETFYISSVDLKYAFWQIELEEESRPYTAFTVPNRPLYQFRVMPFGLCNAAQRLCRLMDRVIPSRLKENVFIYLDDLLVISSTFEHHMELLAEVAKCLREANLTIGLKKSMFCFQELKYLGFIIGGGMLKTDPEKVIAIRNIKIPRTTREVRSFLGTAGWYRRFIKDFASISAPLTDTLKKSRKFVMTTEAIEAFERLKKALTTAPVLRHADFTKRFWIQCDASDYGIGAVSYQLNDRQEEHPIAFYSQKLNSCQKNYTVTEKECLAAVMAIRKFRPYVEMMPFTVVTDHASLKWLMSLKDLSGRLARWSLQLQAFNFDIQHRKGTDNVVADMLSRVPNELYLDECGKDLLDFETVEFESDEYLELIKNIKENSERLPDLKIENGMVFKKAICDYDFGEQYQWKLWVPSNITNAIIENAHATTTSAHGGTAKTIERVKRFYYWPKMSLQIREYVKSCQICKESKPTNVRLMPGIGQEVKTERPFQKLYIDFLGKYPRSKNGNCYVFIVVDHFSKFTFLKAMKDATTNNVVQFLVHEIFHKFGVPEIIHSDNGAQFIAKGFQTMIEAYKIQHIKTAIYSPQSNASERVNQSVLAAIRSYLKEDHRDWDMYLTEIECALRSSIHSATGVSPFFALFGFHMFSSGADYKLARQLASLSDHEINTNLKRNEQLELIRTKIKENMHEAYEKSAERYNKRARIIKLIPGQEVYRRNHVLSDFQRNINAKFCKKFVKCRIVRAIGGNMYEIETLQGKPVGIYHAKDIKT